LSGFSDPGDFQRAHREWVERGLENGLAVRDDRWLEAIAVGSRSFIEKVKSELGVRATHRDIVEADGGYALREPAGAYASNFTAESETLGSQNTFFWDESVDEATL